MCSRSLCCETIRGGNKPQSTCCFYVQDEAAAPLTLSASTWICLIFHQHITHCHPWRLLPTWLYYVVAVDVVCLFRWQCWCVSLKWVPALSINFFVFVFSGFILFFFPPFVAESTSVGQHREAWKVITETGGRLPDSSRNWYVFCFWIGVGKVWGFKIVVRMSERQQIVLLICEVGGYVCLCVCLGGSKKKKNSFLDAWWHSRKHIKGKPGRERERCTGDRSGAASPCSAPEENLCIDSAVCVCVVYACVLGGWWYVVGFFLFFFTQTDRGSMKINNVSIPPEVLNSGVQKEEKKHNITF